MITPAFTGVGLNDLINGGTITATRAHDIKIVIDGTGPDTFKWYLDDVLQASTQAITGAAQALTGGGGATITLAAAGHTADDYWEFTAFPLFPSSIAPAYGYTRSPVHNIIRTPMRSGRSLAVSRWLQGGTRYSFSLPFSITPANADTLLAFWNQQDGEFGRFEFVDLVERAHTLVRFGHNAGENQADASRTTFDLPFTGMTGYTVYDDGAAQVEGGGNDYTISSGTGQNGCDQCVFNAAPGASSELAISCTGQLWHIASFGGQTKEDVTGPNLVRLPQSIDAEIMYYA